MSGILSISNVNKTIRYLKKNGLVNTYYAAKERVELKKAEPYQYVPPTEDELVMQRENGALDPQNTGNTPFITVVMPAYETPENFLREAIEAVVNQTYSNWEFIIADASETDRVKTVVDEYIGVNVQCQTDSCNDVDSGIDPVMDDSILVNNPKIRYIRLEENKGISANTNAAIKEAKGEYVALLDHDDVYTPDALYEMVSAIGEERSDWENISNSTCENIADNEKKETGMLPAIIYSDEDKLDSDSGTYFDPHRKYDFNYDLLLTNNYICHLIMIKRDILQKISLREQYDGAQDYDLVLQIVRELVMNQKVAIADLRKHIVHVPKVLYHWRSHANSTAENTASKTYAYEAGLAALEEHVELMHEKVCDISYTKETDSRSTKQIAELDIDDIDEKSAVITVTHSKHLGFYKVKWGNKSTDIFKYRPEVGAIIGRVLDNKGRMIECIKDANGNWLYAGINRRYAGELNRFDCAQDVAWADPKYVIKRDDYDAEKNQLIYYDPEVICKL